MDDGIATGVSMETAVLGACQRGAGRVLVATPIASSAACESLRQIADEVFCLLRQVDGWTVGQHYTDFTQVSDEEIRRLLEEGRAARAAAYAG